MPGTIPVAVVRALLFWALLAPVAGAPGAEIIRPGKGVFTFTDLRGESRRPLRVFYRAPRVLRPDTPVLFVLHGRYRNAREYRDVWGRLALCGRVLLLAPEFRQAYWPGSYQYQQGNLRATPLLSVNAVRDWAAWCKVILVQAEDERARPGKRLLRLLGPDLARLVRRGANRGRLGLDEQERLVVAIDELLDRHDLYDGEAFSPAMLSDGDRLLARGVEQLSLFRTRRCNRRLLEHAFPGLLRSYRCRAKASRLWAYSAVEHLFDHVRLHLRGRQRGYLLYGHSAGGQFVHRLLLLLPGARVLRAVAANAGRYTMPDLEEEWPYGLKATPAGAAWLRRALARELVVMAGAEDTGKENLATTPRAMAQGANRLARARAFIAAARSLARARGWPCNWRLRVVPGAGHNNSEMAPVAARLLLKE